jgi:hypothetical protein
VWEETSVEELIVKARTTGKTMISEMARTANRWEDIRRATGFVFID